MKYTVAVLLAATGLAAAHRRQHRHQHAHKVARNPNPVDVYVPGPTQVVYELNGKPISESEVMQGIANGTLVWGDAGELEAPAAPVSIPQVQAAQVNAPPVDTPKPQAQEEKPEEEKPQEEQKPAEKPQSSAPVANYQHNGDFPDYDDSLDCGDFPSAFGPVALDYLGLNGFAGVQWPKSESSFGFDDILTLVANTLGSHKDYEGAFFSYACPVGYQNVQWPAKQGATKQSVGGLLCQGGKLKLTRGDVTKKLCDAGTDKVAVKIKNTLGEGVAVCRTNYPGPEDETIPTFINGGSEEKVACPDADNYYMWDGGKTSAQLYVNPKGVSQEEGCQWGSAGKPVGNWAPLNLGVGYSAGMGWISIFQNAPTTTEKLDFSVHIEGDDINGKCKYDAGKQKYCSGENYDQCNDQGCTVAVKSGTAYYVFSS